MDPYKVLSNYLGENSHLKAGEIEIICSHFQAEHYKKEEPIVIEGKLYQKVLFISDGIARVYVHDSNGEEVVKNFLEPNSFFAEIDSYERNIPSILNVSAITDCSVVTLSKLQALELIIRLPEWSHLMQEGAMRAMNEMIRKQNFLRQGTSVDQYRYFVEHFPVLAQEVPLKYIASYLRITQSSLSRIRKQGW